MQKLIILNTREIKKLKQALVAQFNYALTKDYAYLQNEKNRIFIVNKDISKLNLKNLRIDKLGLYFAEYKNNQARLSKEGAILLVQEARQNKQEPDNVITLSEVEIKEYFQGSDLTKNLGPDNKLVILETNNNVLGCAQYKEQTILNFLPKIHRGEVI
jgi:NOL1/NOP2/fmu family ribosome biogenesis protein